MAEWQPMKTAPRDGREFLAWFQKIKLDDDDNPTTEVVGGAQAIISFAGGSWNEPEWLSAHGSWWMEDWCFADEPVLWHPLPPDPVGPIGVRAIEAAEAELQEMRAHGNADDATEAAAHLERLKHKVRCVNCGQPMGDHVAGCPIYPPLGTPGVTCPAAASGVGGRKP